MRIRGRWGTVQRGRRSSAADGDESAGGGGVDEKAVNNTSHSLS